MYISFKQVNLVVNFIGSANLAWTEDWFLSRIHKFQFHLLSNDSVETFVERFDKKL